MGQMPHLYPFEATYDDVLQAPDRYVDSVFSCLESEFLVMPKGNGFVEYATFDWAYEALKSATGGFRLLDADAVFSNVCEKPAGLVVLRTMLGFTPPEWGYVATRRTGVEVSQGFVRNLDRKVRMTTDARLKLSSSSRERVRALVETACEILASSAPDTTEQQLHRLDKADTKNGLESLGQMASLGAPYSMLLYERFLGRPFAGHRDSVSDIIGDVLESAIEDVLTHAGISFRKTKRAERLAGFDQTPDFIVPNEFNPQVVIESKITEDDGTARDKATRIQHLGQMSLGGRTLDNPKYEVIACIGGRGFGVRREDMKKMILATRGKVFTAKTLSRMVECTKLNEFRTR